MIGMGHTIGICAASGARSLREEELAAWRTSERLMLQVKATRAYAVAERLWLWAGYAPSIEASNRAALRARRAEEIADEAFLAADKLDY